MDVKEIQNQQKKEYLRGYRSYVQRINRIVSELAIVAQYCKRV